MDREALAALRRRHGIRRLALFGPVLRGGARPDSEVDVLVEFQHFDALVARAQARAGKTK